MTGIDEINMVTSLYAASQGVRQIAKEIEKDVTDLMTEHYHHLEKIATLLIEKETLYDKDIDDIINDTYGKYSIFLN